MTHKEGDRCFSLATMGGCVRSHSPASQSELYFGNHFLAPGQEGPL